MIYLTSQVLLFHSKNDTVVQIVRHSEGRESDESPDVFASLMFQMPSIVEGGMLTVSDPSSPSPVPAPRASPTLPCAEAEVDGIKDRRSISFSGVDCVVQEIVMYFEVYYICTCIRNFATCV